MTISSSIPQILPQNLVTQNPLSAKDHQCEAHFDSQSSKTLTLDPDPNALQVGQDPQESVLEEDHTNSQNEDDAEPRSPETNATASRWRSKRRKLGQKRIAQERKSREKLQVLIKTLKPIPFMPAKILDFTRHEALLRRLGLWDFVHVGFDSSVCSDFLAQLIASYSPALRCSYVNGVRIMVNRTDMGRALKLPVRKTAVTEHFFAGLDLAESIAFIEELVSNWILLHEDTYTMPPEVLANIKLIKEANLEKVDWAGLIWSMVEKELRAPQLSDCYYASHLQLLIKIQHEELLREASKEEVEVKDVEEEEEDGSCDVKVGRIDDCQVHELEEHTIEFSLGQDNVEKVDVQKEPVVGEPIMDFEQFKEEPVRWLLDQKNNVGEPFLQLCSTSDVKGLDCGHKKDEGRKEEGEQEEGEDQDDEHEGGFHLSPKCIHLEEMTFGTESLIQAIYASHMPFNSGVDLHDSSVGDFLSARDDPQMISGTSFLGNAHKKDICLDNHNSHQYGSNKRLRSDNPCNAKPVDFYMCVDQIQNLVEEARSMYATKEKSSEESTMNQQLLLDELCKRDSMIEHLHKEQLDESQRRQMEVYRACQLEKELYMMADLVEGYRKAVRETQKAFAEYRVRCPQADEPFYKDVPESGGLVLSVMELEKERLKQEQEERMQRLVIEKKLREFERDWISKLEGHLSRVQSLGDRLLAVDDKVELLNEMNAKCKVSNPPECASL